MQGEILGEKLIVPRLRVRKDWYQNLDPDPTDHTHPDLGINPDAQDGTMGEDLLKCKSRVLPGAAYTSRGIFSAHAGMHLQRSGLTGLCVVKVKFL